MSKATNNTAEKKPEATQNVKVYLVCVGRRGINNQKEMAYAYYQISSKQATGEEEVGEDFGKSLDDADSRMLCWKKLKWHVGAVIEVEARDTNAESIFPGTASLLGRWQNEDDIVRWKSFDTAWADYFDAKKSLAKAKNENALRDALDPVREAYKRLPNIQRAQLIARVVQYIVR